MYSLTQQGGFHAWENCPCQDSVFALREGDVECVTLCDGAGSLSGALKAAEAFSQGISRWFVASFAQLLRENSPDGVRRRLLDEIDRILDELTCGAVECRSMYGCTLLSVCRDCVSGEALSVQIGDGVILRWSDRRETACVHPPEDRQAHRSTWLVNNSRDMLMEHIRVRRDPPSREGRGYCLMSDGGEGRLYTPTQRGVTVHPVVDRLIREYLLCPGRFAREMPGYVRRIVRPADDFSIGVLGDVPASALPLPGGTPRRVAGRYAAYLSARRCGAGSALSARRAGIRKRDLNKCMKRLTGMGIEEV